MKHLIALVYAALNLFQGYKHQLSDDSDSEEDQPQTLDRDDYERLQTSEEMDCEAETPQLSDVFDPEDDRQMLDWLDHNEARLKTPDKNNSNERQPQTLSDDSDSEDQPQTLDRDDHEQLQTSEEKDCEEDKPQLSEDADSEHDWLQTLDWLDPIDEDRPPTPEMMDYDTCRPPTPGNVDGDENRLPTPYDFDYYGDRWQTSEESESDDGEEWEGVKDASDRFQSSEQERISEIMGRIDYLERRVKEVVRRVIPSMIADLKTAVNNDTSGSQSVQVAVAPNLVPYSRRRKRLDLNERAKHFHNKTRQLFRKRTSDVKQHILLSASSKETIRNDLQRLQKEWVSLSTENMHLNRGNEREYNYNQYSFLDDAELIFEHEYFKDCHFNYAGGRLSPKGYVEIEVLAMAVTQGMRQIHAYMSDLRSWCEIAFRSAGISREEEISDQDDFKEILMSMEELNETKIYNSLGFLFTRPAVLSEAFNETRSVERIAKLRQFDLSVRTRFKRDAYEMITACNALVAFIDERHSGLLDDSKHDAQCHCHPCLAL